jgi:iron complex transport system substrate-binding protein
MRILGRLAIAAACAAGQIVAAIGEPIVVRDALERAVTLTAPPQRIVTIFASNTEMVAALGLADRIVGIEAYTRYPPEVVSKPLVGGRLGFSVDAVVALQPDLVVVTPARQAVNQLLDPMQRLGVPVLVLLQRSVPEIFANIRLLGRVAGVPDRGEELAGYLEARLASVMRRVADRKRPRAVMITGRLGNGLLLIARPGTYTGDAIELAGGHFALDGRAAISPGISRSNPRRRSRCAALCRIQRCYVCGVGYECLVGFCCGF